MAKVIKGILVERFGSATFLGSPMSVGMELAKRDIRELFESYVGMKLKVTIEILEK